MNRPFVSRTLTDSDAPERHELSHHPRHIHNIQLVRPRTTPALSILTFPPLTSPPPPLSSMISKILLLVKQVRPRAAQIDNLRTPVAVLLQARALKAVEGVGDAFAAAHDALVLVVAEGALVADARERRGAHVGVAHGAFAVAFVAQAADGDAGLLSAHDEVAEVC
jgi:hypothetical protein